MASLCSKINFGKAKKLFSLHKTTNDKQQTWEKFKKKKTDFYLCEVLEARRELAKE